MYMIGQSLKESLEKRFNVIIQKHEDCDPNQAACAGNMIWVGEFDDPEIELAAIFHEIGHIISIFKTGYCVSKISAEGMAWELAQNIAFDLGYVWKYDGKECQYARKCLNSYRQNDECWR